MASEIEPQNGHQTERPLSFLGRHLNWTIIALIVLLLLCAVAFFWKSPLFCWDCAIDAGRWGQFGDFIGGTLGTFLTFLSIVLLYKTFEAQREANELTRLSNAQIDEENKLQVEWEKGRQFEEKFHTLLALYREAAHAYKDRNGNPCTVDEFVIETLTVCEFNNRDKYLKSTNAAYRTFFANVRGSLPTINTHMRLLYQLLSLLSESGLDEKSERIYAKSLRGQLSDMELVLIRYNCWRKVGENMRPLVAKYNIMKHLPLLNLLEYRKYTEMGGGSIPNDYIGLLSDELVLWRREISHLFKMACDTDEQQEQVMSYGSLFDVKFSVSDDCRDYEIVLIQKKNSKVGIKDEVAKLLFDISDEDMKGLLSEFHREVFDLANFNEWNNIEDLEQSEKPTYGPISIEHPSGIRECYKRISFNVKGNKPLNVSYYQVEFPKAEPQDDELVAEECFGNESIID